MNGPYMNRGTADTSRGPSPKLWEDFPWRDIADGSVAGVQEFQDFVSGGLITVPTTHAALVGLPLSGFGSSGATIAYGNAAATYASGEAGTLVLAETTTRESVSVRSDIVPYRISANFGMMCFEIRFKIASITTEDCSFFVGLLEDETLTVDVPVIAAGADTHLIASKDLVGFKKPVADTTTFDAIYRAGGVAAVVVNDGLGTLAADTYIKLGFRFDPRDNYLRYFVNNVEASSSKLVPDNTGTDFPADVPLGFVAGMSVGTAATDNTLTIDWYRCGQVLIP